MPIWLQIFIPLITAFLTVFVTTLANYIVNSPKRYKEKKLKEEEERKVEFDKYKQDIQKMLDDAKEDRGKERQRCGREHLEVIRRLDEIANENKLQSHGLQTVMRNTLKLRYEKWLATGYAPADSKRDLEDMYQAYHKLGANGYIDSQREQFLKLPDERVNNRKKRQTSSEEETDSKS